MINKIRYLFKHLFFVLTQEENKKEVFLFFSVITCSFSFFYALVSAFLLKNTLGMIDCLVYSLFCLIIPVLFKLKVNYKIIFNLFILGGAASVYFNAYLYGGINSGVINFTVVAPLLPMFILSIEYALLWLLIIQITNIIFWYFNLSHVPQRFDSTNALFNLSLVVGLNFMVFAISFLFYSIRNRITIAYKIKNDELEATKINLLETQKHKDVFIANISHELRNPLGIVIGLTSIVEKNTIEPENKKYLNNSKEAANHLLLLINDLLDMSIIESGKISIHKTQFNIHSLIQNTKSFFYSRVADKNLTYSYNITDGVPESIIGDAVRIAQIINNLIDNAIKYSKKGIVHLECDYQNKVLKITITDTGVGIPEHLLDVIFDSFYRVDYSTYISGAGLGLSIVKQLITKLDGSIKVSSKVGEGTSFFVDIPCAVAVETDTPGFTENKNEEEVIKYLKGISILAAEDMPLNQLILEKMLDGTVKDFKIEFAIEGSEVLEKIKYKEYDVILMDINMPGKNGFDTVKEIRALYGQKHKIIALTANALKYDVENSKQIGFNEYVTKPLQIQELLHKIYLQIHT